MAMIRLNKAGKAKKGNKREITGRVKEKKRETEREKRRGKRKKREEIGRKRRICVYLVAFHLQLAAFQLAHVICVREVVMGGAKAEAMAGNSSINTPILPISMGPPFDFFRDF